MLQRTALQVVYCGSWEDRHPPKELEEVGPFTRGWRSARYCCYPQQLIVKVHATCRIRKIQLLSHHYMIASRVELAVGSFPEGSHTSLDQAIFTRLGYISLSENTQTQFKSRELKSVNVDAHGQLIKFVLYHNHINEHNLYNQVGLMALNVIVDSNSQYVMETGHDRSIQALQDTDPVTLGSINKAYISPMDDLAFSVSQDPEIAEMIRKLYSEKWIAVQKEQYGYAKQLKQVIEELQKIGEVLCRYEVEKRAAVDREDYDTAKKKKLKLDTLRQEVYRQLNYLHSPSHGTHERSHVTLPAVVSHPTTGDRDLRAFPSSHTSPKLPPIPPPPIPSATKPHLIPYDERPLPALVKKSNQQFNEVAPSAEGGDVQDKLRSLTDKELSKFPSAVEVFAMEVLKHLFAKQFALREKGLQMAQEALSSVRSQPRGEMGVWVRGAGELLKRALRDSVFSCFTMSLDLLKYVVGEFCKKHRLGQQEISVIMDKTFPVLLERTGDTTPRIQTSAMDTIVELARMDKVKSMAVVGAQLIKPIKVAHEHTNWRLLRCRVELVGRLLLEVYGGCAGSGLTLESVVKFLSPCLEHSNRLVRESAVRVTLDLYRKYGLQVCRWLPVQEQSAERRKGFWKTLFDSFEQIDGKHDFEAAKRAAERRRDETLHKLQAQSLALASLTKKGTKLTSSQLEDVLSEATPSRTASHLIHSSVSLRARRAEIDKTCVFCGEKREEFSEEVLETHYLTDCPVLHQCQYCTEVIEVSGLAAHYLNECLHKDNFKQCPRCRQPVATSHYDSHTQSQHCVEVGGEGVGPEVCPLCYSTVPPGDAGWRSHLLTKCQHNKRRKTQHIPHLPPLHSPTDTPTGSHE